MVERKIPVGAVLAVAVTAVVLNVLVAAVLIAYQRIPNTGVVKAVGVGVYWDGDCTDNVTSVDWGLLEPGATSNVTVYIQNEGNIPVVLNMTTDNWNPSSASDHITLTWDSEDYVLDSDSVVQAVLTLSVSSDISEVTSFGFDIIISGTEHV
ncbi:hypothetical protein KAU30_03415 [Candidatus Bathyarchaeota archaeon]|nr:hypothetical protein [Candidatus Bathyarchaeota archaeon]